MDLVGRELHQVGMWGHWSSQGRAWMVISGGLGLACAREASARLITFSELAMIFSLWLRFPLAFFRTKNAREHNLGSFTQVEAVFGKTLPQRFSFSGRLAPCTVAVGSVLVVG